MYDITSDFDMKRVENAVLVRASISDLTFMDPYIVVKFIKKNPTRCNNASKFYYSIFI